MCPLSHSIQDLMRCCLFKCSVNNKQTYRTNYHTTSVYTVCLPCTQSASRVHSMPGFAWLPSMARASGSASQFASRVHSLPPVYTVCLVLPGCLAWPERQKPWGSASQFASPQTDLVRQTSDRPRQTDLRQTSLQILVVHRRLRAAEYARVHALRASPALRSRVFAGQAVNFSHFTTYFFTTQSWY